MPFLTVLREWILTSECFGSNYSPIGFVSLANSFDRTVLQYPHLENIIITPTSQEMRKALRTKPGS